MPPETVRPRIALSALVAANAVSLLGNVVAAIAVPWFVLVTTGSAARTGVAAFFTTLPLAIGALFGGAVADAIGHRRASAAGDVVSGCAIAAIPLLHAAGALRFWNLVGLAFAAALFDAPAQAAREALLPDVAAAAGTPLERATALWTTTEHVGYVLGAPVAGALIATVGAPATLWLDAGSFAVSALVVLAAVPRPHAARTRRPYGHELVEGIRFVASEPVLRLFLANAMVGNFLIASLGPVIVPVFARTRLGGAEDFGILIGAYGAGGLVGAVAFGLAGVRVPRKLVFRLVWIVYPAASFALATLPPVGWAAAILFVIGLCAGAYGPLEQLVRQERTPPELRARVFATFMASLAAVVPPAMIAAGVLVDTIGLRATVIAFATGNAVLAAATLASPARRSLGGDERRLAAAQGR